MSGSLKAFAVVAAIVVVIATGGLSQFVAGMFFEWALIAVLTLFVLWLATFAARKMWSARHAAAHNTYSPSIARASNGYVEFYGRTRADGSPLLDPVQRRPCVWFAVKSIEGNLTNLDLGRLTEWVSLAELPPEAVENQSSQSFLIADASGVCRIDPAQAKFDLAPVDCVYIPARNVTLLLWRLDVGAAISVWGEHRILPRTAAGSAADATERSVVGQVSVPSDGRPFVISSRHPAQFEKHAAEKSIGHFFWITLGIFILVLLVVASMLA